MLLSQIDSNSDPDILVGEFSNYLNSKGEKYFKRTKNLESKGFIDNDKNKQRWFNEECKTKKSQCTRAIYEYNLNKNERTREQMIASKKDYKYTCRKTKLKYNTDQSKHMNTMRRKSPREFWKLFKRKTTSQNSNTIPLIEFHDYFSKLADEGDLNINSFDSDTFLHEFDNRLNTEPSYPELDNPISTEEIIRATKRLKNNKAHARDNIIYEYFTETIDVIVRPLEILFNYILDKKRFPRSWSSGIIIPIHKRGDISDPNNYRGITLISCFAKLFTSILNERLKQWAETNDILTDAQFGFKPNCSTVDAIFILNALIEKQFQNKGKLYCCYIDYRKAYDVINRGQLWSKMINVGIDGKLLTLIRSMYDEVKLQVKHMGKLSDVFNSNVGLFQGEITSPILFSLFINDIEFGLQNGINAGITLDQISIYLLLFADDAALFSETPEGLQESLNNLETYCDKWNLTVNIEKTKVMVFRKGGTISKTLKWTYKGQEIEIVNNFNYLGIVMSSGGSFASATNTLYGKALKAMHSLFTLTKDMNVPIHIMLNLFNAYVSSILNYNCEVWGFMKAENIERVHRKFCKRILNVKMSTNSLSLYAEVGRFPLYLDRYVRIVKYFLKLYTVKEGNCILKHILLSQRLEIERKNNTNNWSSKVRDILNQTGFNDVWLFPESVNSNQLIPLLKTRLRDQYITNWNTSVTSSSSMILYKELKPIFERSAYLDIVENKKHRNIIAKLRLSSHKLLIETGRHQNIVRDQRKCVLCNLNDIEDEYHFVIKCPYYADIRNTLIPKYYRSRPSMFKFIELLNCSNKIVLRKLAIFCLKCFKLREDVLYV